MTSIRYKFIAVLARCPANQQWMHHHQHKHSSIRCEYTNESMRINMKQDSVKNEFQFFHHKDKEQCDIVFAVKSAKNRPVSYLMIVRTNCTHSNDVVHKLIILFRQMNANGNQHAYTLNTGINFELTFLFLLDNKMKRIILNFLCYF